MKSLRALFELFYAGRYRAGRRAGKKRPDFRTMATGWLRLTTLFLTGWGLVLLRAAFVGEPGWFTASLALVPALVFPLVFFLIPFETSIGLWIEETRGAMRIVAVPVVVEIGVGLFLAVVPIANDRGLVPLLVLAVLFFSLASLVFKKGGGQKWSRRLAGTVALGVTLIMLFGGRDEVEARVAAVGYDPYVPLAEQPPRASRACQQLWPAEIPDDLRQTDAVGAAAPTDGTLTYRLLWAGERPHLPLGEYPWPEGVSRVRLEVRHVRGHLDVSNRYDPSTREHTTVEVSKRRDYGRLTYCLGLEKSYPYYQTLRNFWGPAQTAVVVDPQRPKKGIYPFTEGVVTLEVTKGENPQLLFNNHGPPNGRLHVAEFLIEIRPIY